VKILVVDDAADVVESVQLGFLLQWRDVEIVPAATGKGALELVEQVAPDLVLLDVGLPDIDGYEVLRQLREFSDVPVIMLTARDDALDKVKGLELGADDYVTKPFSMAELVARVRASLRRSAPSVADAVITTEHFSVDLAAKRIMIGDTEVRLSPTQWHVVEALVRNRGRLVTQRQLLQEVWGPTYSDQTHYLRVFMAQIRRKLEPDPSKPRYFITEPGIGYRFEVDREAKGRSEQP
jgi:two-component system, OmpR family, KDP operon response regulator KdpE